MAGWTKEEMDSVRRAVGRGLTFGQIGKQLDRTRSSVAGLAKRLGIRSNNAPVASGGGRGRNPDGESRAATTMHETHRRMIVAAMNRSKKLAAMDAVQMEGVRLIDLHPSHCRWPVSAGWFCGAEAAEGKPYCPEHCERAYAKTARLEARR